MKALTAACATLLAIPALFASEGAVAQDRTVKITGFGAKSGVVRVFGINSEAAMKAERSVAAIEWLLPLVVQISIVELPPAILEKSYQ